LGIREGSSAPLNVADIDEIAVNILTTSGHDHKAHNITGPELLTSEDMARVFTGVTGKKVAYVSLSQEHHYVSDEQYVLIEANNGDGSTTA
jgi:uncharacterized protein YbjT (DUF2867 family)